MSLKISTLIVILGLLGKFAQAQKASVSSSATHSAPAVVRFPSQAELKTFELIKYDHYNFYVSPAKRQVFFSELAKAEAVYGHLKFIQAGEQTYTAEEWIATQLLVDFYGRDLSGDPR